MLFSKALVAYDGSSLGNKALDYAIGLARQNPGMKLAVVHVVNVPLVTNEYVVTVPGVRESYFETGQMIIEKAKEKLTGTGISYELRVLEGQPALVLLEYAESYSCDLIITGSRGLSGIKEMFLGSVSHNIAQRAGVPVLIVK